MKKILFLLSLSLLVTSCTFLRPIASSGVLSESSISSSEQISSSETPVISSSENPITSSSETPVISSSENPIISSSETSSDNSSDIPSISLSEMSHEEVSSSSKELISSEISSLYFKYVDYRAYTSNNLNYLAITFECPINIYKIDYCFDIYKNNGELIGNTYEGELDTTLTETGFTFIYPGLDNEAFHNIGYINFVSLSGESYEEITLEPYTHNIYFHKDEGIEAINVQSGAKIDEPLSTSPNENIKLEGWYLDNKYQKKFNFVDYTIYQDIDLYPYYVLDEDAFDQDVRDNFLTSNMVIYATSYNQNFIFKTDEAVVTGSGVVIDKQNNYTYIITNNHVTNKMNGYNYISYTVKDVYNSTYTASLIYADPSYDLALLRIRVRSNKKYYIPTFATNNPEIGDYVAAVGEPNGEYNTITIGEVTKYKTVTIDDDTTSSDVRFNVITHSAETDHGSSGGALLDTNLNLVGINYAGATTIDGNKFVESYAIPIEKVKEFISVAYEYI